MMVSSLFKPFCLILRLLNCFLYNDNRLILCHLLLILRHALVKLSDDKFQGGIGLLDRLIFIMLEYNILINLKCKCHMNHLLFLGILVMIFLLQFDHCKACQSTYDYDTGKANHRCFDCFWQYKCWCNECKQTTA